MSTFYRTPIHYQDSRGIYYVTGARRTLASEVNDNDYRTYSEQSVFVAQTYGESATDNTRIDSIFIKTSGVTQYSVSVPSGMGTGTGFTNRTIPTTVSPPDGVSVSTTIGGFQNDLVDLTTLDTDGTLNAREVQIEFTGVNIRIYDIMLLQKITTMDPYNFFRQAEHDYIDNSLLKENIRGSAFRIPSLASRGKWVSRYTALFNEFSNITYEEFSGLIKNHQNFVFSPEYLRYPDRVYPATWGSADFRNAFLTRRYRSGVLVSYSIREV